MNVIIYCRVSTDEQRDKGYSLQNQEELLIRYCERNNHIIVGIYTEDYSAKDFDRPEWKKIMSFLKTNKGCVDTILCHKWDRFSRNHLEALNVFKKLEKYKVTVNTLENPLDIRKFENKLILAIYLTQSEVENDKNSFNTTNASRKARRLGVWTGTAPKGYKNFRDDNNRSTLKANDDAIHIKEAFKRMASGAYSADEIRRWLNKKGIKLCKQSFLNLIRNPVYIGKIFVKAWNEEPEEIVMGLHPAIVSEIDFYRAQEVLSGRKRNMRFHLDKANLYPLKGFLKCPTHGTSLTAYGARSRNKTIHHYYLCTKCRSEQRHRVADVHIIIEDILAKISFSAQALNLYKVILQKLFDKEDIIRKDGINKVKVELVKNQERKTKLQDMLLDGKISAEEYHSMKQNLDKDAAILNGRLDDLQHVMTPFRNYINKTIPMLVNLSEYYSKADGVTKQKILGCIFAEKLILENRRVATIPYTIPIQILLNANKVLGSSEKKKEVENDLLSCFAPPAGLEPATL